MFQQHFYHETFKTAIKIFGKMFSNITILRNTEVVPVQINYSQKDKILQKYATWLAGSVEDQANVILPRMGFVMGDPQIDKNKQLNRLHRVFPPGLNKTPSSFNAIPIQLPFTLSIMTKNMDDMFQIIEQIIPFFCPEFSLTINDIPTLNHQTDYIYWLDSIAQESDSWDSTFDDRRLLVWTLSFICDLQLYQPVQDSKLIKKIIMDGYADISLEELLFRDTLEVDPQTANATDDYELITTSDER